MEVYKRFAQRSLDIFDITIWPIPNMVWNEKRERKGKKRKDGLVEIPNSIAGTVYLFNVIRNTGICVGGTWLCVGVSNTFNS